MDFYNRYDDLCRKRGIDPCSQKAAEALGTSRALISNWKKGTKPNLQFVRAAADMLNTTTDYLLGRTDDPTDFSSASAEQSAGQPSVPSEVSALLSQLDKADVEKVVIFMQGLLAGDKYQKSNGYSGVKAM